MKRKFLERGDRVTVFPNETITFSIAAIDRQRKMLESYDGFNYPMQCVAQTGKSNLRGFDKLTFLDPSDDDYNYYTDTPKVRTVYKWFVLESPEKGYVISVSQFPEFEFSNDINEAQLFTGEECRTLKINPSAGRRFAAMSPMPVYYEGCSISPTEPLAEEFTIYMKQYCQSE